MVKNLAEVISLNNLIEADRITENAKKLSNFSHDINLVYTCITMFFSKAAAGEKLSDDELTLLKTKAHSLIADIEAILS